MPRTLCLSILIVIGCLTTGSCAIRQEITGQATSGLDRKLTTYSWIEDGDLVTFIVNTKATRYREDSDYIPLEIAIANRGLRNLTLTRESFVLIDSEKTHYPVASPQELMEGYRFLDFDQENLAELAGITTNKFATFTRYRSNFSPTRGATFGRTNLVRDVVALPKFGYVLDMLYFPKPENGVKGHRFELFLRAPELEDAVFVKFEVR